MIESIQIVYEQTAEKLQERVNEILALSIVDAVDIKYQFPADEINGTDFYAIIHFE